MWRGGGVYTVLLVNVADLYIYLANGYITEASFTKLNLLMYAAYTCALHSSPDFAENIFVDIRNSRK